METRFLDLDNPAHIEAWVLLIIEFKEFGGYLEDSRENIEISETDAPKDLNKDGLTIYKALREIGITDRDQVDTWASSYSMLLSQNYFPLTLSPERIQNAKALVEILDKTKKG